MAEVEYLRSPSHPSLRGVVLTYTGYAERTHGPVSYVELPCTYAPVILDLAEGWTIGDPRVPQRAPERLDSFVAGLTDGPVSVEHPGSACCLQINLTPLGARRLLGVPMRELANRSVALADVLGPEAPLLIERLAAAPDWPTRFQIVDELLRRRMAGAGAGDPGVAWAYERLLESAGGAPIGDLARDLGWSPRRLIAGFRDAIGLAPKTVARIVRFERLERLVAADPALDWARAAVDCGFFDQAHLAHEVRDLAGMTPTALARRSVNSVQDPVPIAA